MKNLLKKSKNLSLVKFFTRYWPLITAFLFLGLLTLSNTLFSILGTFCYVPSATLGAMITALFLRNLFNRDTTDRFSDDGSYNAEWKELDGKTKLILSVVQIGIYFIGACIIMAALF